MGRACYDHTPVFEYFLDELATIRAGVRRYCAISGRYIMTYIDLIADLADRVERTVVLDTRFLGTYCLRAHYSAGVDTVHLPYCNECFRKITIALRSNAIIVLPTCDKCCQWDYKSKSPASKKVPLPPNYPTTCHPDSPQPPEYRTTEETCLLPHVQDFEWLKRGIKFGEFNYSKKVWGKTVTRSYIRAVGLGESISDNIFAKYDLSDDSVHIDEDIVPKLYNSGYHHTVSLDCPLHHLFHGIVPACLAAANDFMTEFNLLSTFENVVNKHLSEIATFRIDWSKPKNLPKKGWLGENSLAFARVMPFIYGQFFLQVQLPQSATTLAQETLVALRQLFNSLHVMLSMLMSPREFETKLIDANIKVFLSCCDRFVKLHYDSSVSPFWATKGNFLSLLNLAEQISTFGSVRLYWEGTRERFIQTAKAVLVSFRTSTSYFLAKMGLIQKLNTLEWLKKEMFAYGEAEERFKGCHRYDSLEEVKQKFEAGLPLSAFYVGEEGSSNEVYILFGKRNTFNFVPISYVMGSQCPQECGFYYADCNLLESDAVIDEDGMFDKEQFREMCASYCLLLPYLVKNRTFKRQYAFVFSDWDVLDWKAEKNIPSICNELFLIDVMSDL